MMRSPGSIFGALLLIAIGGIFLYANMNPAFSPWPWLAQYWPALIIFWGVAKLANYLALRGTPEAAAAARLTGGDIFGLILLLCFGSFFSAMVNRGGWSVPGIVIGDERFGCLWGREYEFTEELVQPVRLPAALALTNLRGDLTVTGYAPEGPAAEGLPVRLVARKRVCAVREAEAERLAGSFRPVLEERGDGYEFRWEVEGADTQALSADLTVEVPQGISLELSARHGDVHLDDLQGDVQLHLRRGDAELKNIRGDVGVEWRGGDLLISEVAGSVEIDGRGDEVEIRNVGGGARLQGEYGGPIQFVSIQGPTSFESRRTRLRVPRVEGELTMASGEFTVTRVPGDLSLATRHYEIEVEEVAGKVEIENRNGPVVLRFLAPPTEDIEVQTRRGDIELYLPEDSGFQISARANDGEIVSDFTSPALSLREESRGDYLLSGTYGTRRTAITLSTTYGTIYLRHVLRRGATD